MLRRHLLRRSRCLRLTSVSLLAGGTPSPPGPLTPPPKHLHKRSVFLSPLQREKKGGGVSLPASPKVTGERTGEVGKSSGRRSGLGHRWLPIPFPRYARENFVERRALLPCPEGNGAGTALNFRRSVLNLLSPARGEQPNGWGLFISSYYIL